MHYHMFMIITFVLMLMFIIYNCVILNRIKVEENEKVYEISGLIKRSAIQYLITQLKVLLCVEAIIFVGLYQFLNQYMAFAFVIGATLSWIAGFVSMYFSVTFNKKVALCAQKGRNSAFLCALSVGSIISIIVNLLELIVCYGLCYLSLACFPHQLNNIFIGLSFGASLISMFARIGGGIFTKGADVGADLVGKVEKDLPEDDVRNPAVIADALGDNIGDANGMSADLFETYIVIVGAAIAMINMNFGSALLPIVFLTLAGGSLASLVILLSGWNFKESDSFYSFNIGIKTFITATLYTILSIFICSEGEIIRAHYISLSLGVLAAVLIMLITEYYTSSKFHPVQSIVQASEQGGANNIIQGLAVGYQSVFITILLMVLSLAISYYLAGFLGLILTSLSLISVSPVILALDAFGPITDNAGGLVEMANLPEDVRKTTDNLDAIGNMTKATTKGYSVFAAGFAAYILLILFFEDYLNLIKAELIVEADNLCFFIGLFIGSMIVALFTSHCLTAVNNASIAIMKEVRRQFSTLQILNNKDKPDYEQAIKILTYASLREMIFPALFPIVVMFTYFVVLSRFSLVPYAGLVGIMIGSTLVGIFLSTAMTVSGGAWDNAKKYIETDGKKKTDLHKAAVIGDTVGDPYKDTAGPSLNPMIKVLGIVSIIILYTGRI